jgi:hypothetical protein
VTHDLAAEPQTHRCDWPSGCDRTDTVFFGYGRLNVWLCPIHGETIP